MRQSSLSGNIRFCTSPYWMLPSHSQHSPARECPLVNLRPNQRRKVAPARREHCIASASQLPKFVDKQPSVTRQPSPDNFYHIHLYATQCCACTAQLPEHRIFRFSTKSSSRPAFTVVRVSSFLDYTPTLRFPTAAYRISARSAGIPGDKSIKPHNKR